MEGQTDALWKKITDKPPMEESKEVGSLPKTLYKRKLGTIVEASSRYSEVSGYSILSLVIETTPFDHHGKMVDKLFRQFSLSSAARPFLDTLEKATGVTVPDNAPQEVLDALVDKKVKMAIHEEWYRDTPGVRVTTLYKP